MIIFELILCNKWIHFKPCPDTQAFLSNSAALQEGIWFKTITYHVTWSGYKWRPSSSDCTCLSLSPLCFFLRVECETVGSCFRRISELLNRFKALFIVALHPACYRRILLPTEPAGQMVSLQELIHSLTHTHTRVANKHKHVLVAVMLTTNTDWCRSCDHTTLNARHLQFSSNSSIHLFLLFSLTHLACWKK